MFPPLSSSSLSSPKTPKTPKTPNFALDFSKLGKQSGDELASPICELHKLAHNKPFSRKKMLSQERKIRNARMGKTLVCDVERGPDIPDLDFRVFNPSDYSNPDLCLNTSTMFSVSKAAKRAAQNARRMARRRQVTELAAAASSNQHAPGQPQVDAEAKIAALTDHVMTLIGQKYTGDEAAANDHSDEARKLPHLRSRSVDATIKLDKWKSNFIHSQLDLAKRWDEILKERTDARNAILKENRGLVQVLKQAKDDATMWEAKRTVKTHRAEQLWGDPAKDIADSALRHKLRKEFYRDACEHVGHNETAFCATNIEILGLIREMMLQNEDVSPELYFQITDRLTDQTKRDDEKVQNFFHFLQARLGVSKEMLRTAVGGLSSARASAPSTYRLLRPAPILIDRKAASLGNSPTSSPRKKVVRLAPMSS